MIKCKTWQAQRDTEEKDRRKWEGRDTIIEQ